MTKFVKKPAAVEAFLFDGSNASKVAQWLAAIDRGTTFRVKIHGSLPYILEIATPAQTMYAMPGRWVVRDERGALSVRKPEAFAATFEPAE